MLFKNSPYPLKQQLKGYELGKTSDGQKGNRALKNDFKNSQIFSVLSANSKSSLEERF